MTKPNDTSNTTRRQFLAKSGTLAAGTALLGGITQKVHAAEDNTIRLALIGCGGRGCGAVADALRVKDQGPVKLYALADVRERGLRKGMRLGEKFQKQYDVTDERRFLGFDAYKKAIDVLKPGDVALCTTRSYIRPIHVEYAVKKGVNVFMEKPFASDPGGLHRLLRAGEEAEKKNLKIAAGLQCRHSPARQALIDKIRAGEMGDITLIRANRLEGGNWLRKQADQTSKFMDQLKNCRIHLFWLGSGHMIDYLIHQIDECCWLKDSWPVSAHGFGGRVPNSADLGQNIDVYSMEFTFADGTKAFCGFRRIKKGQGDFRTFVHGTKRAAQFSGQTHKATVHMFKDQRIGNEHIAWTPEKDKHSPWQYEWNELIKSIRTNRPHNEAKRAVYSDLTSQMGRAACHLNKTVTWDQMMKSEFLFCDYLDKLTYDSPAPVLPDETGQFPVPVPGKWKEF